MTVKELIELLQKESPDAIVVLSKDGEGNLFSPLNNVEPSAYRAVRPWYGELSTDPPSVKDSTIAAVVLWPSN